MKKPRKRDLVKEREQMRRWRAAHPKSEEQKEVERVARRERTIRERDSVTEKARAWRKAHPEEARARGRADYGRNREKRIATSRAWRLANLAQEKRTQKVYREAHKERTRQRDAARYERDKDAIVARSREWRKANLEKARIADKEYHEKNRERANARKRAWFAAHPSYGRDYEKAHPEGAISRASRRRARKKGNGGSVTSADLIAQRKRQKGRCFYCATKLDAKAHHDHIWPLCLGGSSHPCNIVLACPRCNLTKSRNEPHVVGLLL